MPRISDFYGIAIFIYYEDHAPPHFHAIYGEHEVAMEIATGAVLAGQLPRRARLMVEEWMLIHRTELQRDWDLAAAGQPLDGIPPLA